jgi:hypothetical protein
MVSQTVAENVCITDWRQSVHHAVKSRAAANGTFGKRRSQVVSSDSQGRSDDDIGNGKSAVDWFGGVCHCVGCGFGACFGGAQSPTSHRRMR